MEGESQGIAVAGATEAGGRYRLPVIVPPAADHTVTIPGAGMTVSRRRALERVHRHVRSLAVVVVPPAAHAMVGAEAACKHVARAEVEESIGRRGGLRIRVTAPACGEAVVLQRADTSSPLLDRFRDFSDPSGPRVPGALRCGSQWQGGRRLRPPLSFFTNPLDLFSQLTKPCTGFVVSQ